jgi:hypothetical protein
MTNAQQFIGDGKHTWYNVEVSYPSFSISMDRDELIENIARMYGGDEWASGSGLGGRDVSLRFRTLIEALAFIDNVRTHAWLKINSVQWFGDINEGDAEYGIRDINWRHLLRTS